MGVKAERHAKDLIEGDIIRVGDLYALIYSVEETKGHHVRMSLHYTGFDLTTITVVPSIAIFELAPFSASIKR